METGVLMYCHKIAAEAEGKSCMDYQLVLVCLQMLCWCRGILVIEEIRHAYEQCAKKQNVKLKRLEF